MSKRRGYDPPTTCLLNSQSFDCTIIICEKQEKVKRNGRNFTKFFEKTIASSNLCGSDWCGFVCNPNGTKGVLKKW